jgi:undecaprenyl-diphosphatase
MRRGRTFLAAAGALGAAAWVRRVVLPKRPADAAAPRARRHPDPDARPAPDGKGVRIVVNPSSGPAWSANPADELRERLPAADIHELGEGDDLADLLCDDDLVAIGAAGGDGTLSAVARIAADRDVPMVAVPAGTLNHLARDLCLDSVDDVVAAIQAGTFTHMDLGVAAEHTFVNTLTFGGYTTVVDHRERLEGRLGKWGALAVALVRELPGLEPLHLEVDGHRTDVWLAWIGNGRYDPTGFGPSWRETLDDGLLDVRLVIAGRRFSRIRFLVDVLSGRLGRCPVYREWTAEQVEIRTGEDSLRVAVDGETFDAPPSFRVHKRRRALAVAVPPAPADDD